MIVEDFIMLGRTVPEQSKKHGLVVCSAGYSKELRQFMRVYPITMLTRIARWNTCRLAVQRSVHDCRVESWRLQEPTDITITGKANREAEYAHLAKMASGSIAELNEQRASLGIIKASKLGYRFDGMKPSEELIPDMFPMTKTQQQKRPRLTFTDSMGEHDIQLRDWGSYEFLRKQPAEKHHLLWSALHLENADYDHLLFVGNHNHHRNNWLVIGVISEKARAQCAMSFDIAA